MKDTIVCFRISRNLRAALEEISRAERRSLSATIENILHLHVGQRGERPACQEKRRHPRRGISVRALVSAPDGTVYAGTVRDISLGGLSVSAVKEFCCPVGEGLRMFVVFTLPSSDRPLLLRCVPRHFRTDERSYLGASFAENDEQSRKALHRYLTS
ncbi:MAG: PilZ domain-containing protein [Syntrophorhabdales bacterium]|jgi:hypothetical protein